MKLNKSFVSNTLVLCVGALCLCSLIVMSVEALDQQFLQDYATRNHLDVSELSLCSEPEKLIDTTYGVCVK